MIVILPIHRQAKNSLRHRVLFDIRSVPHLCFFFSFRGEAAVASQTGL